MTTTLAVETSSVHYGVALADGTELVAYRTERRDGPDFPVSIGGLAAAVVEEAGTTFARLGRLAVDVGPVLGDVRAGVAYVNGLAFSLGGAHRRGRQPDVMVSPLLEPGGDSVLCLRRGGGPDVYAALFTQAGTVDRGFGPPHVVVPELVGDAAAVVAVGVLRHEVAALLPHARVKDSSMSDRMCARSASTRRWPRRPRTSRPPSRSRRRAMASHGSVLYTSHSTVVEVAADGRSVRKIRDGDMPFEQIRQVARSGRPRRARRRAGVTMTTEETERLAECLRGGGAGPAPHRHRVRPGGASPTQKKRNDTSVHP